MTVWIKNEISYMNFNDKRLQHRFSKILEALGEHPSLSIPGSCQSMAETKGAYRFFANNSVNEQKIMKGFSEATINRINQYSKDTTFLFISDSTNIVLSSHKKLKGVGVLRSQRARGLNLHTTIVSTEEELALGAISQDCWGRKPEDYGKRELRKKLPMKFRESYRWIESLRKVNVSLPRNYHGIFLADRGADIYELFLEKRAENLDLIIRAKYNRMSIEQERVFSNLEKTNPTGMMKVEVKRSGTRKERTAKLEIRFSKEIISAPSHKPDLPSCKINIVSATEIGHNSNVKNPIYWKILTTLEINTLEDAIYIIKTYAKRWLIERFHYSLKQGCKVEDLQFEDAKKFNKAIATYSIIAWRIMYATYLARVFPNKPCTKVFNDNEWRALTCYFNKTNIEPKRPPTLRDAIFMLAKIGGFLGRKSDGAPGLKVIWRGLQTLEGAVEMYCILKRCG